MNSYIYENNMDDMNTGVFIQGSRYSEIFHNTIDAITIPSKQATGIELDNNKPAANLAIKAYYNDITVDAGYNTAAIRVNEDKATGGLTSIENNTIKLNGARYGIFVNNGYLTSVAENTITEENFANRTFGIYLTNAQKGNQQIAFNTITGNGSYSGTLKVGLFASMCSHNIYDCNTVDNVIQGYFFNNFNDNAIFRGNEVGDSDDGLYLTSTGVLGAQFDGTLYNGNLWTGTYGNLGANSRNSLAYLSSKFIVDGNSPPIMPSFNVAGWFTNLPGTNYECPPNRIAPGDSEKISSLEIKVAADSILTDDYINETNWVAKKQLYEKLKANPTLVNTDSTVASFKTESDTNNIGFFFDIKQSLYNLDTLSDSYNTEIRDNIFIIDSLLLETSIYNKMLIADTLSSSDSLQVVQQSEEYEHIVDSLYQVNESLEVTIKNLKNNAITLIGIANGSINISEQYEINEKVVNEIYSETIAKNIFEFDSIQTIALFEIANQCPDLGGPAVYEAIGLYNLIDNTVSFEYDSLCSGYGLRETSTPQSAQIKQEAKVEVFPNPASNSFTLHYLSTKNCSVQFILTNSVGEIVIQNIYSTKDGAIETVINTSGIPSGLYQYKITSNNGETRQLNGKIAIIK